MDEQESKPVSWRRFELLGVGALALAMSCLFLQQAAERYAANFTPPTTEIAKVKPRFNVIDYAETGATKNTTVIIGPCGSDRP